MAEPTRIDLIRENLEAAMAARGISPRALSTAAKLGETAVRDLMKTVEDPRIGTLEKLADVLSLPLDALIGQEPVELRGNVGAGGEIGWLPEGELETVPRPPGALGRIMALRVIGDSMLPKYAPGDIVYVRRDHDGVLPEYLGDYCAIHAEDGGTYLKILSGGTVPERYTLRSLNAADMENVEVVWASPVIFIMPARAYKRRYI